MRAFGETMAKGRRKSASKSGARPKARKAPSIPKGFRTITPYLAIRGAADAIEWYKRAFGAKELDRQYGPGGLVLNAMLKIGDSMLLLSDIFPGAPHKSPLEYGGSPVTVHLFVNDVDAVWRQAVAAGARPTMPLGDQFWGDRYGQLVDPFGHEWSVATHKEDLTPKQREARAAEWAKQFGQGGPPP
jgi:uncharacterized glyoxalase superfamily protein PhnB